MFWLFSSLIGDASFGSSFGSWLRKKPKQKVLVDKFWEDPWSTKTKPVLVKPKVVTKTCFITETNPFPTFDQIIQLKMGSMFPPRRVVIPSSPHLLSVPACHSLPRRLLPLWIHRFRQICPVLLRSPAESEVAYFTCTVVWWTRYYVAFCWQLSKRWWA